jgi:hypothetical protein
LPIKMSMRKMRQPTTATSTVSTLVGHGWIGMRNVLQLLLLLLLSLLGMTEGQIGQGSGPDGCWNNITAMNEDLMNRTGFASKVYILCSNSILNLTDSTQSIQIRSNVRYQCGANSDPMDQCIVHGGFVQIVSLDFFGDISHDNAQIVGLTFTGEVQLMAILEVGGDILFQNCLFRVCNACMDSRTTLLCLFLHIHIHNVFSFDVFDFPNPVSCFFVSFLIQ